jgi:prepilin-type processing-associated H-X9-DG protein
VRVINPTAETRPPANPVPAGSESSTTGVLRYPSSRHSGGVVAVFADGHARFLSEKIASWVYCQMLTSNSKAMEPEGRAWNWQRYEKADGTLVRYIFDDEDLDK